MNENEKKKTLTQLANDLNISKSSIYRKISKEPLASELAPYMETINNAICISEKGIEIIMNSPEIIKIQENSSMRYSQPADEEEEPMIQVLQNAINILQEQLNAKDKQLREQLEAKDKQLEAKDEQINKLTEALCSSQEIQHQTTLALQAAEALHNSTMKQLTESTNKKTHWWSRKKKEKKIIDVENEE